MDENVLKNTTPPFKIHLISSLVGILCTTQKTKIKTKLSINAHETLLWIHFEPIAKIEKVSCPITGIRKGSTK